MDENNSIGIALEKLSPQENDVIVVKPDPQKWDVNKFIPVFDAIRDISPCPVIPIPNDMCLETESIDYLIQYLEDMKKN